MQNCTTFNELRSTMYIKKNKSIIELPPTSNTIAFHLRRCYYFIRMCSSFLDDIEFNLSLLDYGWKRVDSVLYPIKGLVFMPHAYTITCGCKTGMCKGRCKCKIKEEQCTVYCKCKSKCI